MSTERPRPLPGTTSDPLYPETDGRPLGASEFYTQSRSLLHDALVDHFAATADVYVAANMMVYHEEGNPTARHAPGLFVARGVGKHRRLSFRV